MKKHELKLLINSKGIKKHELLKLIYDKYPKDTKVRWSENSDILISSGSFEFNGDRIHDSNGKCFFDIHDERVWPYLLIQEPEKSKSILSEKCAIQVSNEREFKLLMEHYESNGWRCISKSFNKIGYFSENEVKSVSYGDLFHFHSKITYSGNEHYNTGYKIIPFSDFCAEIGIEAHVFIMTSEDGVPLYVGDRYYRVYLYNDKWATDMWFTFDNKSVSPSKHAVVVTPHEAKAFSTKEAADVWIKQANKPKEVVLNLDGEKVVVNDKVIITGRFSTLTFDFSDLEQIYKAYKSLQ